MHGDGYDVRDVMVWEQLLPTALVIGRVRPSVRPFVSTLSFEPTDL